MCLVNSERLDIYLFLILHLLVRCGVNRIILSFSFIKIKEESDKINSFNIFSSITSKYILDFCKKTVVRCIFNF